MKKIKFEGSLAKKYGASFEIDVHSPLEALVALFYQLPGFKEDFRTGKYQIFRRGVITKDIITPQNIQLGLGKDELVISPVIAGAGAAVGIAIATTLIVAAITYYVVLPLLIQPVEYPVVDSNPQPSFVYNGPVNVSAQGIAVPLVYGQIKAGSITVSGGVISEVIEDHYIREAGISFIYIGGGATNTSKLVDVISEGEIEGLVDEDKSIFFEDTPFQNSDGSYNFQDITYQTRSGTPVQTYIPGFSQLESAVVVDEEIEIGTPVTRQITDPSADAVRIKIRLPQGLWNTTTLGRLFAMYTRFIIEVQEDGGSFVEVKRPHIYGVTTSLYEQGFRIELPEGGNPWTIRLTNVGRPPLPRHRNRTDWASYDTIIDAKLSYPDTALAAIEFDQKNFNDSVPKRAYEVKGIKLQIPDNYDPLTKIYTGMWGGTFQTAWSDNPAWVMYDLLISKRYGIGQNIDASQVDKWALYEVAQFCDEQVETGFQYVSSDIEVLSGNIYEFPAGHGETYVVNQYISVSGFTAGGNNGQKRITAFSGNLVTVAETLTIEAAGDDIVIKNLETRYAFNAVISKRESVYATLNAIASNFHGLIYWGSNVVSFSYDHNSDPVKIVTPANVIDGMLDYAGTSAKDRHSAALVTWNDPQQSYKIAVEVVENFELIDSLGWKPIDVIAFGCTSRGQAYRYGKYVLLTEKLETERLSYQASFDHADVSPGEIISVADPAYAGVRLGGRVTARTKTSITIDAEIEIEAAETYVISVTLYNDTIEDRTLTNTAGTGQTVMTFTTPLTNYPLVGSMWSISASNVEPRQFRVISITESEKNLYDIVAVFHDPNKFSLIEQNIRLEVNDYSNFPVGILPVVTDIQAREYTYRAAGEDGAILAAARISWEPPTDAREESRIAFYEVHEKRPEDGGIPEDFTPIGTPSDPTVNVFNITAGTYAYRIRVLGPLGAHGAWVEQDIDLLGSHAPPEDVTDFNIEIVGSTALLSWTPVTDVDLSHYRIRYSSAVVSAVWGSSVDIATKVFGNQTSLSARVGTYLIKAVDVYGSESVNAALIISTVAGLINFNVVETVTESPDYLGTHVDTFVFDGILQLGSGLFMSDWVTLASVEALEYDVVSEGIYYFFNTLDLGAVFTSRLTSSFDASGWNKDTLAVDEENWDVILQIRTTLDDPSGSPAWTDWQDFLVTDYTARAFEWRIKLISLLDFVTPYVENLSITVDMPDRVVGEANITSPSIGLQVDYDPAFKARPALAADGQDLATGDYKTVTGADETGFFIRFFDSGDVGIERTFDYLAKGYGA